MNTFFIELGKIILGHFGALLTQNLQNKNSPPNQVNLFSCSWNIFLYFHGTNQKRVMQKVLIKLEKPRFGPLLGHS